ncbi:MAG: hypothetical protein AAF399_13390 [Bacteroidota bacterium]
MIPFGIGVIGLLFSLITPTLTFGQWMEEYLGDEKILYAETKQINQFFRRFNGEEDLDGTRFYPGNESYRLPKLRKDYLNILFDEQNHALDEDLKRDFMRWVLDERNPVFLDFHGGNWFAEVTTTFRYEGRTEKMTLFLELEKAEVGSKWVFENVYFEPFNRLFQETGEEIAPAFIHPMSHELDFMNLIKIFRNDDKLELYASKAYQPDYLTLFVYENKRNNLEFVSVDNVKFHFFQVDGWYFELQEFRRKGMNRGWLISQMTSVPAGKQEVLMKYIYRR